MRIDRLGDPLATQTSKTRETRTEQPCGGRHWYGLRNQEAADFTARERTGVNIQIRFAIGQTKQQRVHRRANGAAVVGDETSVITACQGEIEGLIVASRCHPSRESGKEWGGGGDSGGAHPGHCRAAVDMRSRGRAGQASESERDTHRCQIKINRDIRGA